MTSESLKNPNTQNTAMKKHEKIPATRNKRHEKNH